MTLEFGNNLIFLHVIIYYNKLSNFSKDNRFNSKTAALLTCSAGIVKKSGHFSYR